MKGRDSSLQQGKQNCQLSEYCSTCLLLQDECGKESLFSRLEFQEWPWFQTVLFCSIRMRILAQRRKQKIRIGIIMFPNHTSTTYVERDQFRISLGFDNSNGFQIPKCPHCNHLPYSGHFNERMRFLAPTRETKGPI